MTQSIDGARLILMLNDLRLPAIKQNGSEFAERADQESLPPARVLSALAKREIAECDRRHSIFACHWAKKLPLTRSTGLSGKCPNSCGAA